MHAFSQQPMQPCMQITTHAAMRTAISPCNYACRQQPMQPCMQTTTHAARHTSINPCDACIQPTAHATVHADNNACSHAYSHQPMQLCMQATAHATVHADNYACSQAYIHQPMQVCLQPTTHATMHAANNQCTPRMQPITHETHATACPLGYPPTLTRGEETQQKGPRAPPAAARSRRTRSVAAAGVAERSTMDSARSPQPLTADPGTAPSAWRASDSGAYGM